MIEDGIGEAEAVTAAGVSASTLRRFAEAGYLQILTTGDGSPRYSRAQIDEIFGVHQGRIAGRSTTEPRTAEVSGAAPQGAAFDSEDLRGGCMLPGNGSYSESVRGAGVSAATAASANGFDPVDAPSSVSAAEDVQRDRTAPTAGVEADPESRHASMDHDELQKLRQLVELQERMLANKETEVSDLRQQREWLQRRVERLEEKGERDQILLLSVTQTNRQLVSLQEGKRSAVRQLLEWLGFPSSGSVTPTTNKGIAAVATTASGSSSGSYRSDLRSADDTIEVREAANG